MSALPATRRQVYQSELRILEIAKTGTALDLVADRLTPMGYEIISATSYEAALEAAHDCQPALIVLYDNPAIDALRWLEIQHTDPSPRLAMIPLIVLADPSRVEELRAEEIADRVVIIPRRAETLNRLTITVKRLVRVWELEQKA